MITALITAIALTTTAPVQVQADTIPASIQVKPVEYNRLTKDTVTQITWTVFGLGRDTTLGCNSYVVAYDRKGNKITDRNIPIPAEIVKQWGTDSTLIDDYILKFYNLQKKQ
jgi:hypothetical protein